MDTKTTHRDARQETRTGEAVSRSLKRTFVDEIHAALREQNMTRSALAARLGTSRQYITRVLNDSTNFTIESMAEIAAALGRDLTIQVTPNGQRTRENRTSKREPS